MLFFGLFLGLMKWVVFTLLKIHVKDFFFSFFDEIVDWNYN